MSTSVDGAVVIDVVVDDEEVRVRVKDGRTVSAPLSWFPLLSAASPTQRSDWRLIGEGEGIHWPQLDEDISVAALLHGHDR
ncbi:MULTISPECIES: DUF2442 domain-containing protein [Microbacterium]|uniref:DUF2442 domain-containing protein n=1 Tax=Microbacterium TaxID=33882 RepID=UPI000519F838|nr:MULTISPECIES: DUF2442 domain-containing protein [Microbacterium]MCE7481085.1 DUF2442 domain-containing protein [Microbacterium profundi]